MYFEAFNRGKRSLSLDLRVPMAREVLEDLVRESDCLFATSGARASRSSACAMPTCTPSTPPSSAARSRVAG
jgi:hypothetical protein